MSWGGGVHISLRVTQLTGVTAASHAHHIKSGRECLVHVGGCENVDVCMSVCWCACVYPSSIPHTNRNEELMASQRLIQIPVALQRTSGVIISCCLILHLLSLSLPVVSVTYGVQSLKAAELFGTISTTAYCLKLEKHFWCTFLKLCNDPNEPKKNASRLR